LIERIELKNFCQHRDFSITLDPKMTAIIGSNGSGKSNIFSAIIGALVNEWTSAGNKADNITYGSGNGQSYVDLSMIAHGNKARIRRFLKGGESSLVISKREGTEEITGESQITEAVLEILGISKKMLMDYVIVRQGTISGILSSTQADRAKSFQRLFGTEKCELIYTACLPKIASLSVEFDQEKEEEVTTAISETKAKIEESATKIQELSDKIPSKEEIQALKKAIDNIRTRARLLRELEELKRDIKDSSEKLASLEKDQAEAGKIFEGAEKALEELGPQAEEAKIKKRLAETYIKTWERKEKALKDIAVLKDKLSSLSPPEGAAPEVDLAREQYIQSRLMAIDSIVNVIDPESKRGDCPVCLTPDIDFSERLVAFSEENDILISELASIEDTKEKAEEYKRELSEFDKAKDRIEIQIKERSDAISNIEVPDKPEDGEWDKTIDLFESSVRFKESAASTTSRIESSIRVLLSGIERTKTQLGQTEKAIEEIPAHEEEEQDIHQSLEKIETLQIERASHEGTIDTLKKAYKDLLSRADKIKEEKHRAAKKKSAANTLSNVRSAFHRNGIPAQVSRYYLNALTTPTGTGASINELLEVFESPFSVELKEEDLSFVAKFSDGKSQPAERLSGGEKVVLSLALRTAVNALFASHLHMLFLDEPTEYLDERNLDCLQTAIENLGRIAENKGLQVGVITHETKLSHLFDRVIEL
jgi:DNA repair protein SbcC/Rad50